MSVAHFKPQNQNGNRKDDLKFLSNLKNKKKNQVGKLTLHK